MNFHNIMIIIAVSNFSVQYNFNSISIALIIMSESQCTSTLSSCKEGEQSSWVTGTVTAMVFLGAITGQLAVSNIIHPLLISLLENLLDGLCGGCSGQKQGYDLDAQSCMCIRVAVGDIALWLAVHCVHHHHYNSLCDGHRPRRYLPAKRYEGCRGRGRCARPCQCHLRIVRILLANSRSHGIIYIHIIFIYPCSMLFE